MSTFYVGNDSQEDIDRISFAITDGQNDGAVSACFDKKGQIRLVDYDDCVTTYINICDIDVVIELLQKAKELWCAPTEEAQPAPAFAVGAPVLVRGWGRGKVVRPPVPSTGRPVESDGVWVLVEKRGFASHHAVHNVIPLEEGDE